MKRTDQKVRSLAKCASQENQDWGPLAELCALGVVDEEGNETCFNGTAVSYKLSRQHTLTGIDMGKPGVCQPCLIQINSEQHFSVEPEAIEAALGIPNRGEVVPSSSTPEHKAASIQYMTPQGIRDTSKFSPSRFVNSHFQPSFRALLHRRKSQLLMKKEHLTYGLANAMAEEFREGTCYNWAENRSKVITNGLIKFKTYNFMKDPTPYPTSDMVKMSEQAKHLLAVHTGAVMHLLEKHKQHPRAPEQHQDEEQQQQERRVISRDRRPPKRLILESSDWPQNNYELRKNLAQGRSLKRKGHASGPDRLQTGARKAGKGEGGGFHARDAAESSDTSLDDVEHEGNSRKYRDCHELMSSEEAGDDSARELIMRKQSCSDDHELGGDTIPKETELEQALQAQMAEKDAEIERLRGQVLSHSADRTLI